MANNYVPTLPDLQPGEVARSADVNDRYTNTEAGFDKLPDPAVGKKGFSGATPVGEPTDTDHATTKNYVDTAMTSQVVIAQNEAIAAAASAAAALASEGAASTSETNSAASEAAALSSQNQAALEKTYAEEWSQKAEDVAVSVAAGGNGTTEYSALHHSAKSAASAAASLASEGAAQTAQGLAETARTGAETAQGLAETAQTAAELAQTNTEAVYDAFDDRYLGAKASNPTLDNDGAALLTGALYFNTSVSSMRVYDGATWSDIVAASTLDKFVYTATAAQTVFTGADDNAATLSLTVGQELVFLNGVAQKSPTDYTATTSAITLTAGANLSDELEVYAFQAADIADVVPASTGGNFAAPITVQSNVVLDASDIGVNVQAYDATILNDSDIGVSVQAYDADTAKTDVAQTYTASQRGTVTTDNDLSYDMAVGNNFVSSVSSTGTLTFTNITAGQSGNITMTVTGTPVISAAASVRINATELSRLSTAGVYRISYYSPDGTNVDVSVSSSLTAGGA